MRSAEIGRNIANEIEASAESSSKALAIMRMVGELEGTNLTRKQHFGAAVIGGAMRVYDDAFDRYDIRTARKNGAEILDKLQGKEVSLDNLPQVGKSLVIAQENLNSAAIGGLIELTRAQIDSLQQRSAETPRATIEEITKRKGGATALLFALEVNPNMSAECQDCYRQLGYLMQLIDDFTDVEKDLEHNIVTLMTLNPEKKDATVFIKRQVLIVKQLFERNYDKNKLTSLFSFIDSMIKKAGI